MSTNIALVVLDSVRADYFWEHFDWLDGIRFTNAWSTGNYSIPAHGSLFGGRYPSELGVHAKSQALDCPEPVLAERLRSAGYRTRAYSANELVGPDLDFDRGFDEFNLRWDLSSSFPELYPWREALQDDAGAEEYARAVVDCLLDGGSRTIPSLRRAIKAYSYRDEGAAEALSLLESVEFGDEEFLFLNLMEAHWPYWGQLDRLTYAENPIDDQSETIPGGDIDLSAHREGYEEWVEYLSDQYRAIHELLLDEFDYVLVLSDHGDLFGEHGARAHFYGLFEELVRIPFVIADGSGSHKIRDDAVSLVDVCATVEALAGLSPAGRGLDLTSEQQPNPRLVEFHGFRDDRLNSLRGSGFDDDEIDRYDKHRAGVASSRSYGYESVDGFVEVENTVADTEVQRTDTVSDLQTVLETLRDSLDVRDVEATDGASLSTSTRERLQRLGYID